MATVFKNDFLDKLEAEAEARGALGTRRSTGSVLPLMLRDASNPAACKASIATTVPITEAPT